MPSNRAGIIGRALTGEVACLGRARLALAAAFAAAFLLVPAAQAAAGTLNIEITGTGGEGTVTSSDGKINCSGPPKTGSCSASYFGQSVTLTATEGAVSSFTGWTRTGGSGGCTGGPGENPCTVTVGFFATVTVTANFNELVTPPTVVINPVEEAPTPPCTTEISATGACFSGTVNPNGNDVSWHFEYRRVGASAWSNTPVPDGDAGSGETAIEVVATTEVLEPNTEYEVRLWATNETTTATSGVETFHTLGSPPNVTTEKVWSISDTSATLTATINPNNSLTSFHFEYVGDAEFQANGFANASSSPNIDIGSGGVPVPVTANVEDLLPSTAYHFRIVATNECAEGCGNATGEGAAFMTRPPVLFPERHYELVSAADTNGVEPTPNVATADGERYAYVTFIPTPPEPVSGTRSIYVSSRGPDGSWSQRIADAPAPPPGNSDGASIREFFSSDLSVVTFSNGANLLDPDDQNDSGDTYLKQLASGAPTWISRDPAVEGPQTETGAASPEYISSDGSRVIFGSVRPLLPVAPASVKELYQWDEGALDLISRVPSSGVSCDDAVGPACIAATEDSRLGSDRTTYDTVSLDGSRVVFHSGFASSGRLYVRLDGESTVEASASSVDPTPLNVSYQGADANAESIFFTSSSPLTEDSTALDTGPADLYAYDVETGSLRDLTPSAGGADVKLVYDVSEDGSRVYFTSSKRLNEAGELTEEGQGLQGAAGGPNLYLAELDGSEVNLAFIATIDAEETTEAASEWNPGLEKAQAWREVAASPDGSLIAFRDRLAPVPGRATGGRPQVFVYDAPRDELSCASCPPDGAEPASAANLPPATSADGVEPTPEAVSNTVTNEGGPHPRNVSTDGAVFFQTATALLDADTNGGIDVYEWRGGKLDLISAGLGAQHSIFASASADGSTVFFRSADSLAPAAQAGIQHIYAARVGPAPEAPTPAPPCRGADCRGPTATSPSRHGAGSAAFRGRGNVTAHGARRRCSRRQVRRGNRCVSRRALARRICRRRSGAAKRRCIRRQAKRLDHVQKRRAIRANHRRAAR